MLGIDVKEYDIDTTQVVKSVQNKNDTLVGLRLDNSFIENLKVEPVILGGEISGGYFTLDVEIKPLASQLPMVKMLNSSLIDSGLGYVDMSEEIRDLHEQSRYDVLLANHYNDNLDITYKVSLNFDVGNKAKKSKFKLAGQEITVFKVSHEYEGSETNLYFAFVDKDYDGQTMLGTLSLKDSNLKRVDTLKLLSLVSSNPLFGVTIISAEYESKDILSYLYDTTQLGMGVILPYMEDINKHRYFYLYSGETELYIRNEDILNSSIKRVNLSKNGYKLTISLKNKRKLILNFG